MPLTGSIYRTGVVMDNDYTKLDNKPSINGQQLEGDIVLNIPQSIDDLQGTDDLVKNESLQEALKPYAKTADIPDVSHFVDTETLNDYALKTEIPNLDSYAKKADIPDVTGFVTKSEIPDISGKADTAEIEKTYLKTET